MTGQKSLRQVMTKGSKVSKMSNQVSHIISMDLKCKVTSRAKAMVSWASIWKQTVTFVILNNDNHKMQDGVYP